MIMRIIKNTAILSLIIFISSTWGGIIEIFGVKPDVVLVILVWMALNQGPFPAQISGFASGVIEDVLSISPLGFHITSRTLISFLVGFAREYVGIDRFILPIVFTAGTFVIQAVWQTIISAVFQIQTSQSPLFSLEFIIGLVYTALLSPFLFFISDNVRTITRKLMERFR